ncbi:hypothetical protein [Planomonospora parontospora]|uniref:hypothetical protein n=1 Tax=Planomonospora parontospora TaxID=58119 RepID=UPI0016712505|nr:hypothetical protein [Planomonospora parontospora]GGL45557.1 hypothetical protein GCM10014719_53570 [Planomonospora parontospora subsp. antibiotica]GII18640.1 hypothetical protein Ppa05_53660 [Planomonospora parontospora subsp. antibiotica]
MTTTQSGAQTPAAPTRSTLFSDRRFQFTLAAFWIFSVARILVDRYSDQDFLSGLTTGLVTVAAVTLAWQFARARR